MRSLEIFVEIQAPFGVKIDTDVLVHLFLVGQHVKQEAEPFLCLQRLRESSSLLLGLCDQL